MRFTSAASAAHVRELSPVIRAIFTGEKNEAGSPSPPPQGKEGNEPRSEPKPAHRTPSPHYSHGRQSPHATDLARHVFCTTQNAQHANRLHLFQLPKGTEV